MSEIRERAKGIDQLIEAHWYAAYYQGLEHRNHDDEKGSAQKSEIALRTFITDLLAELERVEKERDRLANDALTALAGVVCTPVEGFVRVPYELKTGILELRKLKEAAEQRITELEAENTMLGKWKDAILDACIVSWVMKKEHEHDPKLAVNDLCAWCHSVALDPKVSIDAKKLYDRIAELEVENKRLQERQNSTCACDNHKSVLCKNAARKAIDIVNGSAWRSGIYSRANAVIAIADYFKLEEYDD